MKSAIKSIEKVSQMGNEIADRLFDKAIDKVVPEESAEGVSGGYPDWLADLVTQYKPLLKKWGEKLVRNDDRGEATRELLLEEDEFLAVWKDKERRTKAFDAISNEIGSGFARTLFELLLKQTGEIPK